MNSERENKHKQLLKKRDLCIYRSELTATKMDANEILMMVRDGIKFPNNWKMFAPSCPTNVHNLKPKKLTHKARAYTSIRTNNTLAHTHILGHVLLRHFAITLELLTEPDHVQHWCMRMFVLW